MRPTGENQIHQLRKALTPIFRACGEIILCSNSRSGIILLLSIALVAPQTAGMVLLSVIAATIAARLLREPGILIERGYYGYNAALLGILWLFLWKASPVTVLGVIPAAVGTAGIVALHRRAHLWQKFRLPVLCLPTLLIISILGVLPLGMDPSPWIQIPLETFTWEQSALTTPLLLFGAILLAIAVHSPFLALLGLSGAAFGTGAGQLVSPQTGFIPTLHFFTSASIAMALGSYFIRASRNATFYAGAAILVTLLLWPHTVPALVAMGIPAYSIPFLLVTMVFLYPIQKGLFHPARTGLYPVYADIALDPVYCKMLEIGMNRETRCFQDEQIEKLAKFIVENGRSTVALTGAGISTDSGIPDIVHGYWGKYNQDDFTFKSFVDKPSSRQSYWAMSEELYTFIQNAQPGPGHRALRDLDKLGYLEGIVTQNVDGLHQKASQGMSRVIELHGTEFSVRCLDCGKESDRDEISRRIRQDVRIPYCFDCRGILKTDATLVGEPVSIPLWKETCRTVMEAKLLLVVGTALRIPAISELVERAARGGTKIAIVSLGATPSDHVARYIFRAPIAEVLPKLVRRVRSLEAKEESKRPLSRETRPIAIR